MDIRHCFAAVVAACFSASGAAAESMTLVDSNGVVMGPVAEYDSGGEEIRFPLKVGTKRVLIRAYPDDYDIGEIYYESADCSGAPLMRFSNTEETFFSYYVIAAPGKTLYVPNSLGQYKTAHSKVSIGACSTTTYASTFAAAKATRDLSTIFTPPFKVRFSNAVQTLP